MKAYLASVIVRTCLGFAVFVLALALYFSTTLLKAPK